MVAARVMVQSVSANSLMLQDHVKFPMVKKLSDQVVTVMPPFKLAPSSDGLGFVLKH